MLAKLQLRESVKGSLGGGLQAVLAHPETGSTEEGFRSFPSHITCVRHHKTEQNLCSNRRIPSLCF